MRRLLGICIIVLSLCFTTPTLSHCNWGDGTWMPVEFESLYTEDENGWCWPNENFERIPGGGGGGPCSSESACSDWVRETCALADLGVRSVDLRSGSCSGTCNPSGFVAIVCGTN